MTRFLVSESNPSGYKLEDILRAILKDVLTRSLKIVDDSRPEAHHVLLNDMKILQLLGDAVSLAEESSRTLDRAFGPSTSSKGGPPRIGEP